MKIAIKLVLYKSISVSKRVLYGQILKKSILGTRKSPLDGSLGFDYKVIQICHKINFVDLGVPICYIDFQNFKEYKSNMLLKT